MGLQHDHEDAAGVSVIIPACNEEMGIERVISSLAEILSKEGDMPYEIIVVDDGSNDGTASIVEQSCARLLKHDQNRGYGASLKTGIRNASHELICIIDADGTYPCDAIPKMLRIFDEKGSDMVVASRTGEHVEIPLVRRPAKWVISRLAEIIAERRIPDINSGLRLFRRRTAIQFFNILPSGFSFTTTITLAMMSNDYRVDYTPINYFARTGTSKIRPVRDTLGFIQLILRIALYFAPLKIFLSLGVVLLFIALGWGFFTAFVLNRLADVSTVVIVMTSIQVSVVGLLAELVNRRLPNCYRED